MTTEPATAPAEAPGEGRVAGRSDDLTATRTRIRTASDTRIDTGEQRTRWERVRTQAGEAGARLRDVLEPITRLGWVVLGIGVGAVVLGFVGRWTEWLVLGIAALVLMALAWLFVLGRAQYRVVIDLAYTRVVVGERALGRIEIHQTAQRSLPPATIEVPVGNALAAFHLPRMRPGDVHEDIFAIPTRRRAVLQVGPARSVRSDPLGLLRRQVRWTDPVELYVHPRTVMLDTSATGLVRDLEGITSRELTNSDLSFHALRDYVAGDDRRYIHWKSSARTGKLMVRQFEQTKRSILALGVSTHAGEYANEIEFELAISVLGSLGLQALRDEMTLRAYASERTLVTKAPRPMLDNLSGLEWSTRRPNLLSLAHRIGREAPDSSLVVLCVGSTLPVETLRRTRLLLPAGARVLIFQADPGATAGIRNLGDAQLVTVDSLQSLPRLMRGLGEV